MEIYISRDTGLGILNGEWHKLKNRYVVNRGGVDVVYTFYLRRTIDRHGNMWFRYAASSNEDRFASFGDHHTHSGISYNTLITKLGDGYYIEYG